MYSIIIYCTQIGPSDRLAPPATAQFRGARESEGRARSPARTPGGSAPGNLKLYSQPYGYTTMYQWANIELSRIQF